VNVTGKTAHVGIYGDPAGLLQLADLLTAVQDAAQILQARMALVEQIFRQNRRYAASGDWLPQFRCLARCT